MTGRTQLGPEAEIFYHMGEWQMNAKWLIDSKKKIEEKT